MSTLEPPRDLPSEGPDWKVSPSRRYDRIMLGSLITHRRRIITIVLVMLLAWVVFTVASALLVHSVH